MKDDKVLIGGAVLAAFAASLCCIGPLVAIAFGLGALGAASAFEPLRPYLLAAAGLALAYAFYRTYGRRAAACAPGEACALPPGGRTGRAMLLVATVAVVLFAVSPYLAAPLAARLGGSERPAPVAERGGEGDRAGTEGPAAAQPTATAVLAVKGMTCASCETATRLALEQVPGVRSASASYKRGEAAVEYDPSQVTPEALARAVAEKTGYEAAPKQEAR